MIWKEKGVEKDSYMCFFNPSHEFKSYNYYMHSCGYFQTNADYLYESVGNRPPLLFYIINGSMSVRHEGTLVTAHANEIILLNCHKAHHYHCPDHCEFLFFHYGGPMASVMTDHLIHSNCSPVFHLPHAPEIYQTLCEPIMSLCYQEQISDARLSTIVYATLCLMQENRLSTHDTLKNTSIPDIVQQTDVYIKKHMGDSITLQELASESGLSTYYFARLFKKETGISPIEYVAVTRINYAKLMLRTTNATISQIADFLGYSSSSSFINAFKSRRGISPSQYRHFYTKS